MPEELTAEQAAAELNTTPANVRRLQRIRDLPDPLTREWCKAYIERHHRIEPGTLGHLAPPAKRRPEHI